jgi:hypothetical protein
MISASQALTKFKKHNEDKLEKQILEAIEAGKSSFDLSEDFKLEPDLSDKLTKLGYQVNRVPVNQSVPGVSIPDGVSVPMKTTISFEQAQVAQEQQAQSSSSTVGTDAEVPAESEASRKARNADKMVNSTPVKATAKKTK